MVLPIGQFRREGGVVGVIALHHHQAIGGLLADRKIHQAVPTSGLVGGQAVGHRIQASLGQVAGQGEAAGQGGNGLVGREETDVGAERLTGRHHIFGAEAGIGGLEHTPAAGAIDQRQVLETGDQVLHGTGRGPWRLHKQLHHPSSDGAAVPQGVMAVEGGHQDSIGAGQISVEAGPGLPDQGARGRIEVDQPLQAAGQVQLPVQVPGPRRAAPQIRIQEEAGEVRQHPLGLAANVGAYEAAGAAPVELGGLVLDRNPGQLGAADRAGRRRLSRGLSAPPHRGLQGQVHRQGNHGRMTRARSRAGLQQAGIARELQAHLLQEGQIMARVAAADLEPPGLDLDLATIGQFQAGGAWQGLQRAQVALGQGDAHPGQGADP